jgi:alpha-ketoglutarate-dependent taurine dioxygenase
MPLPLLLTRDPVDARTVHEFLGAERERILADVAVHGAVLLRGWHVPDARAFAAVARSIGPVRHDLSCSAGPRIAVAPGVHTANEAPPSEDIPFHHEMAQCPTPPSHVLFYCEIPPREGGATPLIHSRKLAEELRRAHPAVAARIAEKRLRYVRELPGQTDVRSPLGKSWRDTLGVRTREEAEAALVREGLEWEWLAHDRLRTMSAPTSAFVPHADGDTFFVAAETVFLDETRRTDRPVKTFVYGDGTPLDAECQRALRELGAFAFRACERVPWQHGDVLVIDNAAVMHARDSFTPPRRILVSLITN